MNPFKRLPIIDDGGIIIPESIAILQYLCSKHNIDSLYPKDLVQRARIEGFTHWQHLNLRYSGSNMCMSLLLAPLRTGKPVDEKRLGLATKGMKSSLTQMEAIYLKDTPYLSSQTMTIADLLGVCEVTQVKYGLDMDILANYPKLNDWSELVRQTVGSELFDETHTQLKAMGQQFKDSAIPTPKL